MPSPPNPANKLPTQSLCQPFSQFPIAQNLFSESFRHLPLQNSDIDFYPQFFSQSESDLLFSNLRENIDWRQDHITLYGKTHPLPRLTSWYGDEDAFYQYSGIHMHPSPWNSDLLSIKNKIEKQFSFAFNSVLINYYRSENDSMGWHSDDEKELGENPIIASVSFGGARKFGFKPKKKEFENHKISTNLAKIDIEKFEIELTHGSLLLMQGETQKYWNHAIPKSKKNTEPRINLTFRKIIPLAS